MVKTLFFMRKNIDIAHVLMYHLFAKNFAIWEETMREDMSDRCVLLANYIIEHQCTVRDAAAELIRTGAFPKNEIKRAAIALKERFEIE